MGRVIVAVLAVAAVSGGIIYYVYSVSQKDQSVHLADQQQISALQQQAETLRKENEVLKSQLNQVQSEQTRLAAENEALNKAIAQYKATGRMPEIKLPPLPYPPK